MRVSLPGGARTMADQKKREALWDEATRRCGLSPEEIRMAKELGQPDQKRSRSQRTLEGPGPSMGSRDVSQASRALKARHSKDLERRLFEISIGPLRLLDTRLDKAGCRKDADALRSVLVEWRAWPSLSRFSGADLRRFLRKLEKARRALLQAEEPNGEAMIRKVMEEIEGRLDRKRDVAR